MTPPLSADRLTARVFAVLYLAQAVFGVGLWAVFFGVDALRREVELLPGHPEVMDAFFYPDILIVVVSVLCALGLVQGRRWTVPLTGFLAGCLVYPTLFLAGWLAFTGVGGVVLAVMVPPSTMSSWLAWQTQRLHRPGVR